MSDAASARSQPAQNVGLAGAGDDQHERVVVVAEALPGVVQLGVHRAVDRVVLVGPVVGERHDVVVLLVEQRFVVHLGLLGGVGEPAI